MAGNRRTSGVSLARIKNHEGARSLAKREDIKALAGAFGVTWESLVFFDLGSPSRAIHALFEMAHSFDLRPDVEPKGPMVRTQGPALERFLQDWNSMHVRFEKSRDMDGYVWEQSTYDPLHRDLSFETRYSKHKPVHNAEGVIVARVPYSDDDPYPGNLIKA